MSGGYSHAGQADATPTCQFNGIGLPSLFMRTPCVSFYVMGGKQVSRTRIAIGISAAVGVAAALAVMAAPTARARGHDDTFAVVFVPGLAHGLPQVASPGQMGRM
jgi:hypothetical protein